MTASGPGSWTEKRRRNSGCGCACLEWEVRGNEARNAGSRHFVDGLIPQAKEFRTHAVTHGAR